jgi:hypothetical protein
MSSYVSCACRDCFETAIATDEDSIELCWECSEAGCDSDGDAECCRDDAYGNPFDLIPIEPIATKSVEQAAYDRDLALRLRNGQVGSGMKIR